MCYRVRHHVRCQLMVIIVPVVAVPAYLIECLTKRILILSYKVYHALNLAIV